MFNLPGCKRNALKQYNPLFGLAFLNLKMSHGKIDFLIRSL